MLNPMSPHRHGRANEAARSAEHWEVGGPIGSTGRLGKIESHTTSMRNPAFGGPLTHHVRQASGVPSLLVESDASSSEASMDYCMGSTYGRSYSSDLSQMPPSSSSQPTIEISPGVYVELVKPGRR
jgi:hypothetical protein